MDSITQLLFHDGKFLGIEWGAWKIVGWIGNVVFFSRFVVQWYATEKKKQVTVPLSFWWLSLIGSLVMLIYSIHKRDSVYIFAYAFTWIPYIRNVIIHRRHHETQVICRECGTKSPPKARFCSACGTGLAAEKPKEMV